MVYPIGMIAQTGSVGCTICVTIERYVAVCLPLKARFLCTYGRAKIYVICISIFAILYNIPRFFEVTSQTYYIKDTEDNITSVRKDFFCTCKIGPDRQVGLDTRQPRIEFQKFSNQSYRRGKSKTYLKTETHALAFYSVIF